MISGSGKDFSPPQCQRAGLQSCEARTDAQGLDTVSRMAAGALALTPAEACFRIRPRISGTSNRARLSMARVLEDQGHMEAAAAEYHRALSAAGAEKNHQVKLAGPLYTDSLDAEGTPAGTYIGMVKTNLKIIYENLLQ